MYGMIGKMITAAGKRAEVVSLLLQAVNTMPGCLSYIVAHDTADENGIWITEVRDSKDSHDAFAVFAGGQESDRSSPPDDRRLQPPGDHHSAWRLWRTNREKSRLVVPALKQPA